PAQARLLAEALAIGLLVGIERYKARKPDEKRTAGVRTFAALSLLGGLCGLLGHMAFAIASFAAVTTFIAIGYFRESEHSVGLTTEIAAVIVFWLGYLVHSYEILAISTAIVLTIMLASKQSMHSFVTNAISQRELYDTLKFLAVVLVVYPLLPDKAMGPFDFFNPAKVWLLIALVSTVAYVGYFLVRFFGPRRGLWLSALLGGLVSTTATTMALATRAREAPSSSRLLASAAVAANTVQFPRLLLLIFAVNLAFAQELIVPLLAMAVAALAVTTLASLRRTDAAGTVKLPITNPYSVTPALKFGGYFVAGLFAVRLAEAWLGDVGAQVASLFGGAFSASAVALSVSELVADGTLSMEAGTVALLIGIASNAVVKTVLARTQGTRALTGWLAAGLAVALASGFLLAWLRPTLPLP
ncbi:MAG: DUF4010 domain-containing protein, partial [Deltaproteobacteria bacterium]|nr:DUF4010 domain-containing protein [Deltaproteobacteria bacterium]